LTIAHPSTIEGDRSESRAREDIGLVLAHALGPVLPRKFHVNPAENPAGVPLEGALKYRPGIHYRHAESRA